MHEVYNNDNYVDLVNNTMRGVDASEIEDGQENTLSVNYSGFIPILISGFQELTQRVEFLENEIKKGCDS